MDQLLKAKVFIPPIRQNLVPRPNLLEKLNNGLHRKLTLISAPAGYGKTTLASYWIHAMGGAAPPRAIAWLSLDVGDNDPVRFLAYLIAALNHADGIRTEFGKDALGMLQSNQPPPSEVILTNLINEITEIPNRIFLVLDDYHLIDTLPVHEALTFLIDHLPDHLHLVIATRDDPHLPLARLRARDQMTELRAADMRFTTTEAADFLNQTMGLDLLEEDIATLETRTEGWIAGLQLAAISLQGHADTSRLIQSFAGSHRFVLDYLIEEILDQQSESVQFFLLQTAILDRFNSSLCDAVCFGDTETTGSSKGTTITNQEDGQAVLELLEHANLFIVPLDNERHWYRYHQLFADLLRQRLRQTYPEQIPILHGRASEWYEQNGFADEAIEHALRAEDFKRATNQIERVADAVWERGEETKLRRWLDGLPADFVCSNPQLCIFHVWSLLASGQLELADRALQSAHLALDPGPVSAAETAPHEREQIHGQNKQRLLGQLATTQAFSAFYRGDVPAIIDQAQKALGFLPEQDLSWRSTALNILGDAYTFNGEMEKAYHTELEALEVSRATGSSFKIMIVNLKLAIILRQQGHLQRTIKICEGQMRLAKKSGMAQTFMAGWLLAIWGEVLAERNDLDRALNRAQRGIEMTERGGDVAMLGSSYNFLIRVLFSMGDLISAEEIVLKIDRTAREAFLPPWIMNQKAAWQARIWLAQGKLKAAAQWVENRELDVAKDPTYPRELEYIVLARILITQKRLDDASGLLQRLLEAAEAGGRTATMIEILLLESLANQAGGDTEQAASTLERAITLAEPGGFVRIFVDEGPPMARLLNEAQSRGIAPDYLRGLLFAFPIDEPTHSTPSPALTTRTELVEPLSEREIEVLQLISEGLTNPEIAGKLYLSLNTVKAHTRNIYGKLGVNNRTKAVSRARALGLLPSI